MDSLHEDVTMRTLFKGMIAEDVPQSVVRPGKWRLVCYFIFSVPIIILRILIVIIILNIVIIPFLSKLKNLCSSWT